jgi:dTDP-4-dehydrorhamnose 3,5-epimerase
VQRETSPPGVYELDPEVLRDARGYFKETYHRIQFAELGVRDSSVQDNHTGSVKGTLRGLHYQTRHSQAKLCRVVEGEALDVAVEIRAGSPHFGRWTTIRLFANDDNRIFISAGFARGFLALTDSVQFLYKCSDLYTPSDELGMLWNDPDIDSSWGVASPLVSDKGAKDSKLADIPRELFPRSSSQ